MCNLTGTYKSCEIGVDNCEEYEMCQATHENEHSRAGVCVCQPRAVYDPATLHCKPGGPTTQRPSTSKFLFACVPVILCIMKVFIVYQLKF